MFRTKVAAKLETQILCSTTSPPPENRAVYDIMWKNRIWVMVEPDRTHNTIWHKRIACWIPKASNTHSEYVILVALLHQQP